MLETYSGLIAYSGLNAFAKIITVFDALDDRVMLLPKSQHLPLTATLAIPAVSDQLPLA